VSFAQRKPDIVEALVAHGVGEGDAKIPYAFCYPTAPPASAQSGEYEWIEDLAGWPSASKDRMRPAEIELEIGDRDFELRHRDRIADLFQTTDDSIALRLTSRMDSSQTTLGASIPPALDQTVIHFARGESVYVSDASSDAVERAVRGTEAMAHPQGAVLHTDIPYWNGRTCEIVSWTRGTGFRTEWRGFFPSQEIGTSPDATTIRIKARGQLMAFLKSQLPKTEKRNLVVQTDTDMPDDNPGSLGYIRIQSQPLFFAKSDLRKHGTDITDSRGWVDGEGRVWAEADARTDEPAGASKKWPSAAEDPELEGTSGLPRLPLHEVALWGTFFDPDDPATESLGLTTNDALGSHCTAPLVTILRSVLGTAETTKTGASSLPTYDYLLGSHAMQAQQILRDTDVSAVEDFAADWPEFEVDHCMVGHTEETVADLARRTLRPFGLQLGVDESGRLIVFKEELPAINDDVQALEAHQPEQPRLQQTLGGLSVAEHKIEYGGPTDADAWPTQTIAAKTRHAPSAQQRFVDREQSSIDANVLAQNDENQAFLQGRAIERVATADANMMTIRVPWSDGPFGLGDAIKIVSLGVADDPIYREDAGEREPVTPSNPLFAEVLGKKEVPSGASYELDVLYREQLVQLRAHGGWITDSNEKGDDDTITLHPDPQWSNDVSSDAALFEVGDDIAIYDRHFARQGGPFEVASIDTGARTLTISGTFGLGNLTEHVARVADYQSFDNSARESSEGAADPWTYLADDAGTIGASNDPAHKWG